MAHGKNHYLVLGGTGSIGYAFTRELLAHQEHTTLLARNTRKAQKLFGGHPCLTIAEGDANSPELLKKLAAGASHIFHGINYPYPEWEGNMERITQYIIEAATPNKATILFPGNIYNYGLTQHITETSPEAPCSRKGRIRVHLEQLLKDAAAAGKCHVVNLRLPDFWGPNVLNEGIAPIFCGALAGKAMPWLIRNDIPHQLVYTPDAAKAFYQLSQLQPELPPYALYNFAGEVVPSIRAWQQQIAQLAGTSPRHKVYSKGLVSFLSLFMPLMREIKEMAYLWGNTLLLHDDKLRHTLPQLTPTPMPEAIQQTLAWFRQQRAG
ncbi:NAD-dependent epimerase/dehydratase family protein [Pontibacter beigongshangensis]|uniref:NAD-dependent epimerase/dehydratase family protein n=1 Tax=Pontibacter beigongshangensis TaxID=2574733 RepID=UPI00164F60D4|nr:NAD-dependent epimerase/dehydratase family protein [Pontibacter beigongshangensis]